MGRKNVKNKEVRVRNEELYKAMVELRYSAATSPHEDKRTKRARTRSASKRRDIATWESA